ncbi:uncharacterized protein LOC134270426 [Saccostrea cucullata]|uniref:uncharacterized protein LOC134270426 n=1 Tax=Saccostrea cuccullata TaxID=36930 RepID=UPI002ED0A56B
MEIIPKVEIRLPTFSTLQVPEELVSMWFGSLTFGTDTTTPRNIKQILPTPGIISTVATQYTSNLYKVVGYSEKQIWTNGDNCSVKVFQSDQRTIFKSFKTLSGHRQESIAIPKQKTGYRTESAVPPLDIFLYITENRNLDICISDHGAGAVVVVNQAGELRFRYTGHTPALKNKPFDPRGITTDSQSHILIDDIKNHCVHVIDHNGEFLRYVVCGLSFPWGLCTEENDLLLVAQYRNRKIDIIS